MTKNSVLIVSLLGTISLFVLFALGLESCYVNEACRQWRGALSNDNFAVLLLSAPVFLLSLSTYSMRTEVFNSWKYFITWVIPVAILSVFFTPDNGSFMWSDPKLSVAVFFSVAILLGSIGIVFWKSQQVSRGK